MESNIQDNPKVIWGTERIICHQQLQGTQEDMQFGGKDFTHLILDMTDTLLAGGKLYLKNQKAQKNNQKNI